MEKDFVGVKIKLELGALMLRDFNPRVGRKRRRMAFQVDSPRRVESHGRTITTACPLWERRPSNSPQYSQPEWVYHRIATHNTRVIADIFSYEQYNSNVVGDRLFKCVEMRSRAQCCMSIMDGSRRVQS